MYLLIELFPQCKKEKQMSRFQKLSHVLWYCQYHHVHLLVKVPPKEKQRFKFSRSFHPCEEKSIGGTIFGQQVIALIP
jgi:hypothetical protein